MDKNTLCEAMYALPSGVVVRRKKSYLPSLAILAVGVALIVLYFLMHSNWSNNLASSLILVAGAAVLIGGLMFVTRLTDREGRPALAATGKPLRYVERYFRVEQRAEISRLVEEGSLARLFATPDGQVSGIAVALYHSPDGAFAAMQAYEYIDFEYRAITPIKIVER